MKPICTFRKDAAGEHTCDCERCRFTRQDIENAPEVDPHAKPARTARKAIPEEIVMPPGSRMHDDPDRQPSIYDDAHARLRAISPTARIALFARRGILHAVAVTREALRACEHREGVLELMSILEQWEASAAEAGAIADSIIRETSALSGNPL